MHGERGIAARKWAGIVRLGKQVRPRLLPHVCAEMTRLSRFERPVVIQVTCHGSERMVFDVNDAAAILLRDLHRQTEKRKVAMNACLQVLRGEIHPPAARRAFVAAALEAKILRSD
ncbi:DUF982 domain-containing protein [Mesorhizobium newzealandense]|uniref:DUF982 domain-containing protein n=1 Tax=Mesorhizobium newzealandense TaxID=1300302 RepID=A0ABW4UDM7_9HYPH